MGGRHGGGDDRRAISVIEQKCRGVLSSGVQLPAYFIFRGYGVMPVRGANGDRQRMPEILDAVERAEPPTDPELGLTTRHDPTDVHDPGTADRPGSEGDE